MMRMKWYVLACLLFSMSASALALDVGDVEESSAQPAADAVQATEQPPAVTDAPPVTSENPNVSPPRKRKTTIEIAEEEPWDYSPYRVLIWLVSDDPTVNAKSMEKPLRSFLDRDYSSVWRFELKDAPAAIRSAAVRDIGGLSYDLITSADPVLAVKRDHPEAVRIRVVANVGEFVKKVLATKDRVEDVTRRAAAAGDASIAGVAKRFETVEGGALALKNLWTDDSTEAVLVSRGMAMTLDEPEAKLITPQVTGLVGDAVETYDKIFVVRVRRDVIPNQIDAVELDTLMRHFGPVARVHSVARASLPGAIGGAVTKAFAPIVRIDNAGQRNATGMVRASGLIMDEHSPAAIRVNDVLEPMTRKNDRNGKPIIIGPLDFAFLLVTEPEVVALRAVEGAGFKIGDHVVSVSGRTFENPQQMEEALGEYPVGEKLSIEVDREGKSRELAVELSESTTPLQLQYLGFTAGVRRGQVIVASVIPDAPAAEKLEVGDVIVSVGASEVSSIKELGQLIFSTKKEEPAKLTIEREEATQEVTLMPTERSARIRRNDRYIVADFYAGRAGGLQGRKNSRTFRTALKVRPFRDSTLLRLHLQRNPNFPMIGFELYEKELTSTKMTFVGRTDWNGRFEVQRSDDPFKLLYVKNGGAVLARLPIVPGLNPKEVADLSGDDMRLQAEAYIRGVQNAIVDLIAIRKLFEARILLRLQRGEMEKAETLMTALREQPSNEQLAADMGKKQDVYIKALGTRNANQRRKVDEMFTTTRELLSTQISPKLVRDLEASMIAAKKNGGKLPPKKEESEEEPEAPPAAKDTADAEAAKSSE